MDVSDEVEFWLNDRPILSMKSSFQPEVGDIVNIRKVNYSVTSLNFCVDYSDDRMQRHMRLILNIEEVE